MDDSPIIDYYRKRASESGDTYGPPEIQKDFKWLATWLQQNVSNRDVLEVACGIGHWTSIASTTARWILASDISAELANVARRKVNTPVVDFMVADAYKLPVAPNIFNCGMAQFWLSHVPMPGIREFVRTFSGHLKPGSVLLFIDTKWVEGYRKPIVRRDADGNTYQLRILKDGSHHEILKNYFTRDEWTDHLKSFGTLHIEELEYVWAIRLQLNLN